MDRLTSTTGAIDALVQGALVDLFDAYRVVLKAMPAAARPASEPPEVTAMIGFTRIGQDGESCLSGRLTLSMPGAIFPLLQDDSGSTAERDDWARELTNQLMGRIKNRLLQLGVTLEIGLPVLGARPQPSAGLLVYIGATSAGDVLATLEGMPPESELVSVDPEGLVLEGDALFF